MISFSLYCTYWWGHSLALTNQNCVLNDAISMSMEVSRFWVTIPRNKIRPHLWKRFVPANRDVPRPGFAFSWWFFMTRFVVKVHPWDSEEFSDIAYLYPRKVKRPCLALSDFLKLSHSLLFSLYAKLMFRLVIRIGLIGHRRLSCCVFRNKSLDLAVDGPVIFDYRTPKMRG